MMLSAISSSTPAVVLADSTLGAADGASAGTDWRTFVAGAVGGLIVAAANHVFTRSRERGAWLRELQVDANRELYSSAQNMMTFVTTANPNRSADPLGWDPGQLSTLIEALNHSIMKTMQVGEDDTLKASWALVRGLPPLAYLALPLPGTMHIAGLEQRRQAIQAMGALLAEVSAVMRQDIGLLSRKERRQLKKSRAAPRYAPLLVSPIDRPGAHLERLLWSWQVLTTDGIDMPDSIAGYDVDEIDMKAPTGHVAQAALFKSTVGHWQFGVRSDVHPDVKNKIAADALRLITGHTHAFKPLHNPTRVNPMTHAIAYAWFDVLSTQETSVG
jgi:hypothetical protein